MLKFNEAGYANFGDVCRDILSTSCQYGSNFADPYYASDEAKAKGLRTPYLGDGLDITGDPADYHFMMIHRDSIRPFVTRVSEYKSANWIWPASMAGVVESRLKEQGL